MKKSTRIILTVIIVIALIAAVLLFCAWSMFSAQLAAINTIEKIEDGLYYLEYSGDYGFDAYLARGGGASDAEMAEYITEFLSHGFYKPEFEENTFACSTLSVFSPEGSMLFGRNFDWEPCTAMVVITRPDEGYASVSTVNIDFLGFGEGFLPEGMINKMMSLAAVYAPLDGMNEAGLCVADLMIDDGSETHQDTDKPDITTTAAIRLLLDKCASVKEAVETLEKYDMNSSAGMQHHLAIADAEGNAVAVEYIDNTMYVTKTKAVTNFYLTEGEKYGIGTEQSRVRYNILAEKIGEADGIMNEAQVKDTLDSVSKHNFDDTDTTEWSVIFDTANKRASYFHRENFDKEYVFELK